MEQWYLRIAERLKYFMAYRSLEAGQLSEVTGISKQKIEKWQTGDVADLDLESVEELAKALEISPAYIIMEAEDEFEEELKVVFRS